MKRNSHNPARRSGGRAALLVALLVALAIVPHTGCGMKSGFLRDSRSSQLLKIDLPVQSVRYLRSVSGRARNQALFCIIPYGENLYETAMKRIHQKARIRRNQVLMNLREDFQFTTYLGFFCTYRLTISGDVMELIPARRAGPVIGSRRREQPTRSTAPSSPRAPALPARRRARSRRASCPIADPRGCGSV